MIFNSYNPFRIAITQAYNVVRSGEDFKVQKCSPPTRFDGETVSIFIKSGGGRILGKYLNWFLPYNKEFEDSSDCIENTKHLVPYIIPVWSLFDVFNNSYIFICDVKTLQTYIDMLKQHYTVELEFNEEIKNRKYIINYKTILNGN